MLADLRSMSQTAINLRWTALDVVLDTNTQMHIAHETQSENWKNLCFCFHSWPLLVRLEQLGRKMHVEHISFHCLRS